MIHADLHTDCPNHTYRTKVIYATQSRPQTTRQKQKLIYCRMPLFTTEPRCLLRVNPAQVSIKLSVVLRLHYQTKINRLWVPAPVGDFPADDMVLFMIMILPCTSGTLGMIRNVAGPCAGQCLPFQVNCIPFQGNSYSISESQFRFILRKTAIFVAIKT